jgi:cytochrome c
VKSLRKTVQTALMCSLLATAGLAGSARADSKDSKDKAMLKLASRAGCLACHRVEPGAKGLDGLAPIGPAWRDVATQYRGQKSAEAKLTQTVWAGSNPYDSHWKGKVSGLAMPPNAVVIQEADARALVKWILALDAAKKS